MPGDSIRQSRGPISTKQVEGLDWCDAPLDMTLVLCSINSHHIDHSKVDTLGPWYKSVNFGYLSIGLWRRGGSCAAGSW